MEWVALTGDWRFLTGGGGQAGVWDVPPKIGSLPIRQAAIMATVLGGFTATPERCWFAIWDGYGNRRVAAAPKVAMPNRPMALFAGPLSGAITSVSEPPRDQRAQLWWPTDRQWCVATDVDLLTTYIGGSVACIDALLGDPELEALPVSVDQSVTWQADTINPTPPPPPPEVPNTSWAARRRRKRLLRAARSQGAQISSDYAQLVKAEPHDHPPWLRAPEHSSEGQPGDEKADRDHRGDQ